MRYERAVQHALHVPLAPYREDLKVSRWIFGPGNGKEDRRVTGCPFGFRRSTPSPFRDRMESPYSGHAIEREGKPAKNSVFGAESISPLHSLVFVFFYFLTI